MKETNMNTKFYLTPDWISGFTQSDGSFVINYSTIKHGIPVRPTPVFNLTQSNLDYDLFIEIQKYLGIGRVYKNRQNVTFVVRTIDEIVEVLLPLFDKHPLRGSKLEAYNIFKAVVLMIKEKKHLTLEGIIQILNLSYFMNKDTSLRTEETKKILEESIRLKFGLVSLASAAPKIELLSTPALAVAYATRQAAKSKPMNLEFVRGLVDGDGSFNVSFATNRRRITVNFTVVCELSSAEAALF